MVNPITSSGSLAQEAIQAALRRHAQAMDSGSAASAEAAGSPSSANPAGGVDFGELLREGVQSVDGAIQRAEGLPEDVVSGKVTDFHEIAAQIKTADLSFKLALEIRNKLVDAYREVMRMNV